LIEQPSDVIELEIISEESKVEFSEVLEEPPLLGNLIKEGVSEAISLDGLLSEIVPDPAYKSTLETEPLPMKKTEKA